MVALLWRDADAVGRLGAVASGISADRAQDYCCLAQRRRGNGIRHGRWEWLIFDLGTNSHVVQQDRSTSMKSRFSMIVFLQLFSLALMLISVAFRLMMKMQLDSTLLLTGVLGILVGNILAVQKTELDRLKAEVAVLSGRIDNS
jgi:hypothetical protein